MSSPDPLATQQFVRGVRSTTGLKQADFADKYGIPVGTLRCWEQGQREPDSAALVLLAMIEREPRFVASMIQRLRQEGSPYVSECSREQSLTEKIAL